MSSVVDLARDLIRFNTVNPPGDEELAMRRLGDFLSTGSIDVRYQPLGPNRVNLVARLPGTWTGHLVLCGHMDVVHPGASAWEHDPFAGDVVGGRLIGRGATDMKGGVAAMAQAMRDLALSGFRPTADLILAITCGEEVDMAGARLLGSSAILAGTKHVVIGEPTGLDIFRAEKGVFWPKVTAHGRTAHGAMPHLGINAISFIARFIERIESHPFEFEPNDLLGGPTLSINVVEGGVKTNVVADRCFVELDFRLVPGQSTRSVLDAIEEILNDLKVDIPVETEIEILQDAPPLETPSASPLVAAAVQVVQSVTNRKPTAGGVSYATDGALIAPNLGADMIICGPGGVDQLHQPNEWVEIGQLEQAVEVYRSVAEIVLS